MSPAPDSDEEAEIRINFQSSLGEGWVAANMSGHWEVRLWVFTDQKSKYIQ